MTPSGSTNFFARQEQARKSCRNQLILFAVAVFIIVLVTTMAIRLAWYLYVGTQAYTLFNANDAQNYHQKLSTFTFFDPAFFLFMAMVIVMVILAASLIKMNTLQKGGGAVAEMLGGRKISADTTDPSERRLMNVVEEMAIASGIPAPQVYVLDSEHNINAFAAGLEIADSAVAVTNGALTKLNRDELQGVIGHEFSHILNGDSRLNVQLIGILFGILFLGIAGRQIIAYGRISVRLGLPGHSRRGLPDRDRLYRNIYGQVDAMRSIPPEGIPGRCIRRSIHAQSVGSGGRPEKNRRFGFRLKHQFAQSRTGQSFILW